MKYEIGKKEIIINTMKKEGINQLYAGRFLILLKNRIFIWNL